MKPGWRDVLDVLKQGLQARFKRANVATVAAGFGILGALVAGAAALAIPDRYQASGIMYVRAVNSSAVLELVSRLAMRAFSDEALTGLIERYNLYPNERKALSAAQLLHRMKEDITIRPAPRPGPVFLVSFTCADRPKAQKVARELIEHFMEAAAKPPESHNQASQASFELLSAPDLPQRPVNAHRLAIVAFGLAAGALAGAIAVRSRRQSSSSTNAFNLPNA